MLFLQVDYLAESGKYTVVIFDNRGMGHSGTCIIYNLGEIGDLMAGTIM